MKRCHEQINVYIAVSNEHATISTEEKMGSSRIVLCFLGLSK